MDDGDGGFEHASDADYVVVAGSGVGPYGQRIIAGSHVLAADEAAPIGADTGPNPYALLLTSLGACTSMTCACTPGAR